MRRNVMPYPKNRGSFSSVPVVTEMQVIPVAGHDSMLLNLSGAHSPFFTSRKLTSYTITKG